MITPLHGLGGKGSKSFSSKIWLGEHHDGTTNPCQSIPSLARFGQATQQTGAVGMLILVGAGRMPGAVPQAGGVGAMWELGRLGAAVGKFVCKVRWEAGETTWGSRQPPMSAPPG